MFEISRKIENGFWWVKNLVTRSYLTKPPVHCRGHIFCAILMKFGQNICFDDFLDKFKNGSYLNQKLGQQVKS